MEIEQANREKARLQGVIRSMVSHATWSEISAAARGSSAVPLTERMVERTVLFTDIAGFSTLSENMTPEAVIALLNAHFQILGGIIYRHNGDIDKFIGDSVMAIFEEPDDAVAAALEIQKAMAELNTTQKPDSRILIRIGVNTGEVVIGNMGNETRMDRTLIGDAVNTAQRLESSADAGGIMISETTFDALTKQRASFRSVGRLRLKGKRQRIRAYAWTQSRRNPVVE
jgi:adenylate cyclase